MVQQAPPLLRLPILIEARFFFGGTANFLSVDDEVLIRHIKWLHFRKKIQFDHQVLKVPSS